MVVLNITTVYQLYHLSKIGLRHIRGLVCGSIEYVGAEGRSVRHEVDNTKIVGHPITASIRPHLHPSYFSSRLRFSSLRTYARSKALSRTSRWWVSCVDPALSANCC
jgi:hypothetical protein